MKICLVSSLYITCVGTPVTLLILHRLMNDCNGSSATSKININFYFSSLIMRQLLLLTMSTSHGHHTVTIITSKSTTNITTRQKPTERRISIRPIPRIHRTRLRPLLRQSTIPRRTLQYVTLATAKQKEKREGNMRSCIDLPLLVPQRYCRHRMVPAISMSVSLLKHTSQQQAQGKPVVRGQPHGMVAVT